MTEAEATAIEAAIDEGFDCLTTASILADWHDTDDATIEHAANVALTIRAKVRAARKGGHA